MTIYPPYGMYNTPARNIIPGGVSGQPFNSAASMFANPQGAGAVTGPGGFPVPPQYAQGSLFNQPFPAAAAAEDIAAPAAASLRSIFPAFKGGTSYGAVADARAAAAAAGEKFAPSLLEAGGRLGPGSIGRAGGYALAGNVASSLYHNYLPALGGEGSNWDVGLQGGLKGAGLGAGIGSMVLPGWGTAAGAVLGGGLGAAYSIFHHPDNPEQSAAKNRASVDKQFGTSYQLLSSALPHNLDNHTTQSVLAQLTDYSSALQSLGLSDKGGSYKDASGNMVPVAGLKEYTNSLIAKIPDIAKQQREQQWQSDQSASARIALQGYISQQMAPYLQSFTDSANRSAAEYTKLGRGDLAAQAQTSAAKMAAAYAVQASGMVGYESMQDSLAYANQVANLQTQQQLSSLYGKKANSTPTTLQALAGAAP